MEIGLVHNFGILICMHVNVYAQILCLHLFLLIIIKNSPFNCGRQYDTYIQKLIVVTQF